MRPIGSTTLSKQLLQAMVSLGFQHSEKLSKLIVDSCSN
jgi:hypothetical protein